MCSDDRRVVCQCGVWGVLQRFVSKFAVLSTKSKPKRISVVGASGRAYTCLVKGREDVHLDARVMKWFSLSKCLLRSALVASSLT